MVEHLLVDQVDAGDRLAEDRDGGGIAGPRQQQALPVPALLRRDGRLKSPDQERLVARDERPPGPDVGVVLPPQEALGQRLVSFLAFEILPTPRSLLCTQLKISF